MTTPQVRGFFDPVTATWSYVVWADNDATKQCAIIDSVLDFDIYACKTSTASADCIINFIQKKGLQVQWILETHIHADHITAAQYLKKQLGGKIAMSKHILAILHTWEAYFQNADDTPQDGSQFDYLFDDNEEFTIGSMRAKLIHTPGHTPADTTYIVEDALFVGDAIFLPDVGSGRCDFPGGSAEHSYDSSRILFSFPDSYKMYVGHDYPPVGGSRGAQCLATVLEQKTANNRLHLGVTKEEFVAKRLADDTGKAVPMLLLPSIQANLRTGSFGKETGGIQFIKLPVNKL